MPESLESWITGRSRNSVQLARVVGSLVSTQKHRTFEGAKLLLVRPLNLDGTLRESTLLAVDGVGAGVSETVLVVLEGRAAGEILGKGIAPVDAAIVGIVDTVTVDHRSAVALLPPSKT